MLEMLALNSMHIELLFDIIINILIIIIIIIIIIILLFLLMTVPFVPSKRRLNSQYRGRTVFNVITQFGLKYKETTLALGLTSFQNKQRINCNNLEII